MACDNVCFGRFGEALNRCAAGNSGIKKRNFRVSKKAQNVALTMDQAPRLTSFWGGVFVVALGFALSTISGPSYAASQTREGVSTLGGRTAKACLLEARKNAIVEALMDVAVTDLRYDANAVKSLIPSLAGDRAVVRRSNAREQKIAGQECSITVRVAIDEKELNRRIKGAQNSEQGSACVPEVGVVMKALYQPLKGDKKEASQYGFSMTEANQALDQALLAQGVKMVSLDLLLMRFINNECSGFTSLEESGRQKASAPEAAVCLRRDLETYVKDNPKLRKPGFVVVTAEIDLTERGRDNYGEYKIEVFSAMRAVTVSKNRSGEFASVFPIVGAVTTPPGTHAGSSYKQSAREAMILATEGAARTISSQFLANTRAQAASSKSYRLVLTNVKSERKQVRRLVDEFHNVGMCQVQRLESSGNERVYQAAMPADDADRLINVVLDQLAKQPEFRDIDYTQNGQTFTIKLP
jgi:hypothetical protein